MKILVTGGAGFIGSHYVRSLLAGAYPNMVGAKVVVLDALTYAGNIANLPMDHPDLTFAQVDICDTPAVRDLMRGCDAVVHFAAESHVDRSLAGAHEFVRTNVLGTQSVMDACLAAGVPKVVHVSTDEVYGSIAEGSWTEDFPLAPNSPYAASKAGSDLIARAFWRSHGLDVSITRCCNNYGPYQHVEKVIPRFVTNLLGGAPVPLYGTGANVREWVHVDDHCRAVQAVLEGGRAGEVYHIGSGEELTNRELTERLVRMCGADPGMIVPVADRKGHDLRYSLNTEKIETELGFTPRIRLDEGLAEVVEWYRDHPSWWQPLREVSVPDTRIPVPAGAR